MNRAAATFCVWLAGCGLVANLGQDYATVADAGADASDASPPGDSTQGWDDLSVADAPSLEATSPPDATSPVDAPSPLDATSPRDVTSPDAALPDVALADAGQHDSPWSPFPAVLLVASDSVAAVTDVQTNLVGTGAFSRVDIFDAHASTPTSAQLSGYASVLVWSLLCFNDQNALGDVLATYYDGGGQVVLAYATSVTGCDPVLGTFGTISNGYMLLATANASGPADSLGTVADPASPLVAGVTSFTAAQALAGTGSPVNGGTTVAYWGRGLSLIVAGVIQGRNRVDLNMYPPSAAVQQGGWVGNGAALMRNALLYH
jgi:hypothetical protein